MTCINVSKFAKRKVYGDIYDSDYSGSVIDANLRTRVTPFLDIVGAISSASLLCKYVNFPGIFFQIVRALLTAELFWQLYITLLNESEKLVSKDFERLQWCTYAVCRKGRSYLCNSRTWTTWILRTYYFLFYRWKYGMDNQYFDLSALLIIFPIEVIAKTKAYLEDNSSTFICEPQICSSEIYTSNIPSYNHLNFK